jgi:hypothetical protein
MSRIDDATTAMRLLENQSALEHRVRMASCEVKAIRGVGMGEAGLTPDHIKQSAEYQEATRRYRMAFAALREFNGKYAKELRKWSHTT